MMNNPPVPYEFSVAVHIGLKNNRKTSVRTGKHKLENYFLNFEKHGDIFQARSAQRLGY